MTESVTSMFESGFARYEAGEAPEQLIPVFETICARAPKNAAAWTSLSWLYLLNEEPKLALKAAQKSVKLDPRIPQARINLVLAMLATGQTGVREHIDIVKQITVLDAQIRQEVQTNIEDGLNRKPDWKGLQRIKTWLLEN